MRAGGVDIAFFHEGHELVGERLIVHTEREWDMIAATQPEFPAVEIEESIFRLKCTETGCDGVFIGQFLALLDAESEVIQVGIGRFP